MTENMYSAEHASRIIREMELKQRPHYLLNNVFPAKFELVDVGGSGLGMPLKEYSCD